MEAVSGDFTIVDKYFAFSHLPPHLQAISRPFYDLATLMVTELPEGGQRSLMLQKLLEAKDCAVRAKLG